MTPPARDDTDHPLAFWLGVLAGSPLIVYGTWWLFDSSRLTKPPGWATTLVAFAVVHDLLVVPAALMIGWIIARVLPRWAAGPAIVAMVMTATVSVFAFPAVRRYGERAGNETLLPHDYTANLLIVLGAIWVTAAAVAIWRRPRRPRDDTSEVAA